MTALKNYGHLALNVLGLLALLSMAEVILYRHVWRLDLTPEKQYTLSSHTARVLENLEQDVKLTAFVRSEREDPRYAYLTDLFWRINVLQPRVTGRVVDINRNPSLAAQYHADAYGAVVVESGPRKKMFSNIREDILTSAVLQVTRNYEKNVYVLSGHGEARLDNTDRKNGYSTMKNVLQQEFYHVKTLTLFGDSTIPDDAATIIIAGPKQDLLPEELLKLDTYLRKGGSLLVMLDPGGSPSLGSFLARYRVGLPDRVVADAEARLASSEPLTMKIPGKAKESVVTQIMESDPVFSFARPLEALPGKGEEDDPDLLPLLTTSNDSWSMGVARGQVPEDVRYSEARGDRRGPFLLGLQIAVRLAPEANGPQPGNVVPEGEEGEEGGAPRAGRMIVYGDADFADNFFIDLLGNRDLLVNSVNWLALEDTLIGVRSERKKSGTEQFYLSGKQNYWIFMAGVVIQPGIFLLLGAAAFLRRRMT